MPRSIWRGAISFGMVSIPVRLFTATESKDVAFRQLHDADGHSRIRQLRWCPVHDREVELDEIVRGYEYSKDRYVILDNEDFEKLPLPSRHTIELSAFVLADEIDPIHYERSYYLEPEETGREAVRAADARAAGEEPDGDREDRDPQQGAAVRVASAGRCADAGDAVHGGRDP